MRRQQNLILMLIALLLILVPSAAAREIISGTDCVVEADQVIEGTLFVLCETLRVSGVIHGDLIGAALRSRIDGTINGNLYFVAGQLDLSGSINGDAHFAGLVLNINPVLAADPDIPELTGSLKAIALTTTLAANAHIDNGILYLGYQFVANGSIKGEVNFWGSALVLHDQVNGAVYAAVGNPQSDSTQMETLLLPLQFDIDLLNPGLIIGENAHIRGWLRYTGPAEGEILGIVRGSVTYDPLITPIPTLEEPGSVRLFLGQILREFITLLAIGGLSVVIMPRVVRMPLVNLRSRPFASFSVGLLAFILSFPIWLLILLVSLVIVLLLQVTGLQELVLVTAIVVGMVNVGGASLFYFVAIFLARALFGLSLGRVILRMVLHRSDLDSRPMLLLAQTVGLLFLAIFVSLPLFGWIFNAAALFLGLGAILLLTLEQGRRIRETMPAPLPAWYAPSPAGRALHSEPELSAPVPMMPPLPPAIDSSRPGMNNLPPGFDFHFFEESDPTE